MCWQHADITQMSEASASCSRPHWIRTCCSLAAATGLALTWTQWCSQWRHVRISSSVTVSTHIMRLMHTLYSIRQTDATNVEVRGQYCWLHVSAGGGDDRAAWVTSPAVLVTTRTSTLIQNMIFSDPDLNLTKTQIQRCDEGGIKSSTWRNVQFELQNHS